MQWNPTIEKNSPHTCLPTESIKKALARENVKREAVGRPFFSMCDQLSYDSKSIQSPYGVGANIVQHLREIPHLLCLSHARLSKKRATLGNPVSGYAVMAYYCFR